MLRSARSRSGSRARRVARDLTSRTGENMKVVPALALPGWFVDSGKLRLSADDGWAARRVRERGPSHVVDRTPPCLAFEGRSKKCE